MKIAIIIVSAILGVCLLPVVISLFAIAISNLIGCAPDGYTACVVAGVDVQGWLYLGVMLSWFGLITLPFAALAALALLVLLAIYLLRRHLRD